MTITDYQKDMERCARCSMCKFIPLEQVKGADFVNVCPSISRYNFHTYSGGGRLITALSMLKGRIDYTDKLVEIVYQCQTCGGCDVSCKYSRDMEVLEPIYQFRMQCVENGQVFCQRLLDETGVAILPGGYFGRPQTELSARLAIVDFNGAQALQSAASEAVDEHFIKRHCSRVTTAIERLAAWVDH